MENGTEQASQGGNRKPPAVDSTGEKALEESQAREDGVQTVTKYKAAQEHYQCEWFTEWFRKALGKKKETIWTVSAKTGLCDSIVNQYRCGTRSPTLKNFLKIVDALGMEVEIKDKR